MGSGRFRGREDSTQGQPPALRFEALNGVVGIQPSWMWFEGNRNGPTLTVDISLAFIGDIFRH